MNDITSESIAGHDVMTLPSIAVGLDHGPEVPAVIRYFNFMKQEYRTSRYALYEGVTSTGVHFSAMIYLSRALHHEERRRDAVVEDGKIIGSMPLYPHDDKFKRGDL